MAVIKNKAGNLPAFFYTSSSLDRTKDKKMQQFFTSESVSEGHPDKVCDQISDAVVDLFLRADPRSRTAIETLATTNQVVIAGETKCNEYISAE